MILESRTTSMYGIQNRYIADKTDLCYFQIRIITHNNDEFKNEIGVCTFDI